MAAKKKSTKAPAKKEPLVSAKKTSVKKKKAASHDEITTSAHETMQTTPATAQFAIKKRHVLSVLAIIVIVALFYIFRTQFVVATVNGQPLSRTAFNTELEKEAGKKAMDALVTKMIILQEADKQHVSVSDQEISGRIKTIQDSLTKQGVTLTQALDQQGLTMADLKEQVRIELLIEKMLGKKIQVSDKEVTDYMDKTQQANPDDTSGTPTPSLSKDQVRQQLQQQKINEQVQPWLQNLQQKAKITKFVNF